MSGSDLGTHESRASVLTCPECRSTVDAVRAPRGRALRCDACGFWLYRGLWSREGKAPTCKGCMGPVSGGGRPRDLRDADTCSWCASVETPSPGVVQRIVGWFARKRMPLDIAMVALDRIEKGGFQPRLAVELQRFEGLQQSLASMGMIQPVLLRKSNRGMFQVIAGQRRVLAARKLGWWSVPALVTQVSAEEADRMRLAENVHREDLSMLEVAESFERCFLHSGGSDPSELARELALDEGRLAELLSILREPPEVRDQMLQEIEEPLGIMEETP